MAQPFLIPTIHRPPAVSALVHRYTSFRYGIDPCTGVGRDACERHVLGGGAALWDTDPSEVIAKSFPNAAVVAEVLWSGEWSGEWSGGGGNDGDDGGGGGNGETRGNRDDGHDNGNGGNEDGDGDGHGKEDGDGGGDGDGDGVGSEGEGRTAAGGRWAEAELRLARFRCALGERGVAAGPVKATSAHFGSCAA